MEVDHLSFSLAVLSPIKLVLKFVDRFRIMVKTLEVLDVQEQDYRMHLINHILVLEVENMLKFRNIRLLQPYLMLGQLKVS